MHGHTHTHTHTHQMVNMLFSTVFAIVVNGIKANRTDNGLLWPRIKMNLPSSRRWSRKLSHANFVSFRFVSLEIRTQSPSLRNGSHVASSNIVN